MVGEVLEFLKGELNAVLEKTEGSVDYIDHKEDPPHLHSPVSMLLVNFEEENQLRPADRYSSLNVYGIKQPAQPPLRLFLHLVFAAKPSGDADLITALRHLSSIMKFFQANPVLEPVRFPGMMANNLEGRKLVVEFNSLNYSQQNEIWSSLKSAYLPSVCYRIKMVIYQEPPATIVGEIEEPEMNIQQK
ncbi:MAG: DUF4255 domain-containing protein [Lewinellaceae bacterium]|nr:DUF4255 domain-containing protein [Lewinellaceae bacterium]